MNLLTLLFFVFIVAVMSLAIIAVNSSEEGGGYTVVVNVIVGLCLTASILFLPFGTDSPKTLFGRALDTFRTATPVTAEVSKKLMTAAQQEDDPEDESEEELPDFVVYECDDYYISLGREDHIMEIVPSKERLADVKATEKLGYYSYSTEIILAGHSLNVYAARLAGDKGFVAVVLFDEYYSGAVNTGFTEGDALFRLHDEEKGYMYGYAYVYRNVESARDFYFYIGSNTTYFDGMYEALKLDKKYFE